MATKSTAAILDLTTDKRSKVKIDGRLYEIRGKHELVYELQREQRDLQRLGALFRQKRLIPNDKKKRARLLDKFVRLILIAPDAIHAQLSDFHRVQLLNAVFTKANA